MIKSSLPKCPKQRAQMKHLNLHYLLFTALKNLNIMSLGELERKFTPSLLFGNGKHIQNTLLVICKTFYQCSPIFFFLLAVQDCSIGFYRENKGLFAGRCVPCNCNGNSNRCQDGTGKCIVSN